MITFNEARAYIFLFRRLIFVQDHSVAFFAFTFTEIVQCTKVYVSIGQRSKSYLVVHMSSVNKGL